MSKEKIELILNDIDKIKKRNQKVEADKAWETSVERKISVTLTTYFVIVIVMYFLKFENIFINAIIPTCGYLLSTLGINPLKKMYIRKYIKKRG